MKKKSWRERAIAMLEAPDASDWLKDALKGALKRDPLDVVNDAEWLAFILRGRYEEISKLKGRYARAIRRVMEDWVGDK